LKVTKFNILGFKPQDIDKYMRKFLIFSSEIMDAKCPEALNNSTPKLLQPLQLPQPLQLTSTPGY
jgi:hypothetical protein